MLRLSANLGFLWNDRALPAAIRAAKAAGFDAVECHWPFAEDPSAVRAALAETGLPMLSLNTRPGAAGEFGLAALPGRRAEARAAIDEAFGYADEVGARAVHVMAGIADGRGPSLDAFLDNLDHACGRAAASGRSVLIEPINVRDVPGYALSRVEAAAEIARRIARPELRILFDCYHQAIMGGDLLRRFETHFDLIAHVQIASVPRREEPGGEDDRRLLSAFAALGYRGFVGAEYRPAGATVEAGLGWIAALRGGG